MSKWMKVDPATLKVGDEVRMVDAFSMFQISGKTSPSKIGICVGGIDFTEAPECRTWYVRKPKKAKPDSEPADGHSAHYWRNKYAKQLNHNERLQAVNKGRAAKLKEAEARLTLKLEETQSQLDDSMMTIDRKNSELTNLRRVLADLQNSDATYDRVEAQAQLQDAWATIDNQAAKIDKWKTKAVALAKQMRADRRDAEPTRPDEPPVGSFFRVDRTGELYLRMHEGNGDYGYVSLLGDREGDLCTWTDITDHGDTITRLLLVEATDD